MKGCCWRLCCCCCCWRHSRRLHLRGPPCTPRPSLCAGQACANRCRTLAPRACVCSPVRQSLSRLVYPTCLSSLSLQASPFTWVHLDHRHMGVGGDDSWSPTGAVPALGWWVYQSISQCLAGWRTSLLSLQSGFWLLACPGPLWCPNYFLHCHFLFRCSAQALPCAAGAVPVRPAAAAAAGHAGADGAGRGGDSSLASCTVSLLQHRCISRCRPA